MLKDSMIRERRRRMESQLSVTTGGRFKQAVAEACPKKTEASPKKTEASPKKTEACPKKAVTEVCLKKAVEEVWPIKMEACPKKTEACPKKAVEEVWPMKTEACPKKAEACPEQASVEAEAARARRRRGLWGAIKRSLKKPRAAPAGGPCTLNVGGRRFSVSAELLTRLPLSRLSRLRRCASERELLELCDDYDRDRNEFFFDRHADAFGLILLYLQRGSLRFLPHTCELSFYNEMLYWGLEGADLQPCCQRRLDDRMSECCVHFFPEEEPRGAERGPRHRRRRWLDTMRRTLEEPTSSVLAQVLASVSVVFVVVSMVMLCASTLPDWRAEESLDRQRVIEAVCVGWFTAECIVRFLVSRDKCEFVRRPLNVIDLLAILPYYVSVTMTMVTGEDSQMQRAGITLRVLRMVRIFWVIKLARHFLGLQTLGLTLQRCYREMAMLLVFVGVAMAIFSALAQLLEHGLDPEGGNEDYASIPAACWWVIISMTTVGYGDMYPVTVAGRVLGGVCVLSGIVLLALPITFIYHSFVQCYHELRLRAGRRGPPDNFLH